MTNTRLTDPVAMAARRWAPESRLASAIRTLEEYGHLLSDEQRVRVLRVGQAER